MRIIKIAWAGLLVVSLSLLSAPAFAATQTDSQSLGIQGTIPSPPPTQSATIAIPANGAIFTSLPITVSGTCTKNLLIKIFDNNVFAGSVVCSSGSFTLQIDLFEGQNILIAKDYDTLDQSGPDSTPVNVTLSQGQSITTGTQFTLSSSYAERGAAPGQELDWPIIFTGGTAPYALSVDWGDGSAADLQSVTTAGTLTVHHTYRTAGVYKVVIKATDKNGNEAFLQLVGQATGAIQSNQNSQNTRTVVNRFVWWPFPIMLLFIFISFWLGRRYQIQALHHQLEKSDQQ